MVLATLRSRLHLAAAGYLLGLLISITLSTLPGATSFSSDFNCPTETVFCLADADCSTCLDTLQAEGIALDSTYADCNELFADVCTMVTDSGCDVDNSNLQAYAACVAEETFGCPGFTNCEDASQDASGTPAPTGEPTVLDSPAPTAGTVEPSTAGTDLGSSTTPSPSGADAVVEAGEGNGVPHTVTGATKATLAVTFGLALVLAV